MKKKILWLMLSWLIVAALVLASCGEAAPGEQEEEEEEEEAGEDVPQYGGSISNFISWGTEIGSADPTAGLWPTVLYTCPVLEHLIRGDFEKYSPGGTNEFTFQIERDIPEEFCIGNLAESWDVARDSVTLHIRQGVYWAAEGKEDVMESRELTAEDVAWSLNRFFDSPAAGSGTRRTENGGWVDSIYAEGNDVIVETDGFNANWLFDIGKGYANLITAPEVAEAGADDWENLVGTGPFMIKEAVVGSHLTYERNPHYWDTTTINGVEYEVPFVDELVWPIIVDTSTQIAAVRTGKIDVHYSVHPEYKKTLSETCPELLFSTWPHCTMKCTSLRTDRPPFNNKEVRRAMMIAIDRETIMKAMFGEGDIYGWPIAPALTGSYTPRDELPPETQELFEYNPDKARQMLADAGYPNGITGVEIAVPIKEDHVETQTMVAAYWTDIGVETTVKPMEMAAFTAYSRSGEHDCLHLSPTNANPLTNFSTTMLPGVPGNYAYYDNPYFTELFNNAQQTVDPAERDVILKELAVIELDDVPYIPIAVEAFVTMWWPWVKNFYGGMEASAWNPSGFLAYAWIDQDLKEDMGF